MSSVHAYIVSILAVDIHRVYLTYGKLVWYLKDSALTAAAYDFLLAVPDWLVIKKWRRLLWSRVRGPRVLDVGAGTGLNVPYYRPELNITALDIGEHFIQRARHRAQRREVPVEFVQGNVQALPFTDGSFDTVVSTFLFCSVDNPRLGLLELQRTLKPGGLLLLLEHVGTKGRLGKAMNVLSGPLYRLTGDHIARDTETLVREAGFQEVSIYPLLLDVVKLIGAEKRRSGQGRADCDFTRRILCW